MSIVHSSSVVKGEGDGAFRLELPFGILNALVALWNEKQEDKDVDDIAEGAEEPVAREDGVVTIKKKNDWKTLRENENT